MIKVANIIEDGRYGGPQARIVDTAVALKSDILTTVIMPVEDSDVFKDRCNAVAVKYKMLPITRITRDWKIAVRYLLYWPIEIASITRFLKREKFDLVHVSGGSWQYKGVIAGKLARKKVLWHLNDTSMPGFIRFLFSLVCRFADGFIFASERSKAYYRPLIRSCKDEFLIQAPVVTKRFDPMLTFRGDDELLKMFDTSFVIGTVANVNPLKGLETYIQAAALLNKSLNNVVFVVIGAIYPSQNRYYKFLLELCSELQVPNIEFVGSRADVRPLLNRFDIYVCSSNAESSPISVWEAMAMAKPVVSTDVGDVPRYVQNGENGFIVNVGDSDAMAKNLSLLLADNSMREEFGKRSRNVAVKELDISHCAERHIAAYNAVLMQ